MLHTISLILIVEVSLYENNIYYLNNLVNLICGSHECIASNITGFKEYKVSDTHSIWAGHMIKHGPNIIFNRDIDPQLVIDFIDTHWDLTRKTDGLLQENQ